MTGGAVAALNRIEQRQAATLLRAQAGAAIEVVVVLAAVRVEARILEFEACEGRARLRKGLLGIGENGRAEDALEPFCVRRCGKLAGNLLGVAVRHLVRGEQREGGLRFQGVKASIPTETARGGLVTLDESLRGARDKGFGPDR